MKIIHFERIDSTNTYLKNNYQTIDHFTWATANYQIYGKGRSSKEWYGDANSLLCSVLIKEDLDNQMISIIPFVAAKSLHQVLMKFNQDILIKWPNDLLIDGKKIAGILVESVSISNHFEAIIIGFGINLNQTTFPSNIEDSSTSLFRETNQILNSSDILESLNDQLIKNFELYKKEPQEVIQYCNEYLAYKNQIVSFYNHDIKDSATLKEIDSNGHLLVIKNNKIIALNSGEITFKK